MEWVTEKDEPCNDAISGFSVFGSEMGCDTSAHRLAPDAQDIPRKRFMAAHVGHDRLIAGFEFFSAIRDATPLFRIEEIEGHDIHTTSCETGCKPDYERARLVSPCTMREHERHTCFVAL
jgi:hypothetical protein